MSNIIIGIGAVSAFLSVSAGAFGGHALKQVLDTDMQTVYQTAVEYQFFHAIGLLVIGALDKTTPRRCHRLAAWAMLAGTVLFSGSLYILSTTGIKWLGMITPIGGLGFLAAWLILAAGYLTGGRNSEHGS